LRAFIKGACIDYANTTCLVLAHKFVMASAPPVVLRAGFGSEIVGADGGGAAGMANIARSAIG
jgi:hypothetical protein